MQDVWQDITGVEGIHVTFYKIPWGAKKRLCESKYCVKKATVILMLFIHDMKVELHYYCKEHGDLIKHAREASKEVIKKLMKQHIV